MSHVLQLGGNIVLAMVLLLLIAVLISVYSMSTNIRRSLQESGIRNIDTLCEIRFLDELDSELQSDPAMDIIKSVDGVEAVTCAWQTGYINTDPALEKLKNIQIGHSFQAIDDEDGKDGLYYIEIDATMQCKCVSMMCEEEGDFLNTMESYTVHPKPWQKNMDYLGIH